MPSMYVDSRGLTAAITETLKTSIGCNVGNGRAPLEDHQSSSFPYVVVSKLETEEKGFKGPRYVAPEADQCIRYMISSFGERHDQVEWLQAKVKDAIIGRIEGHGIFKNDISFEDHCITLRSLGLEGRIRVEGTTYSVDDVYEFEVTSQV